MTISSIALRTRWSGIGNMGTHLAPAQRGEYRTDFAPYAYGKGTCPVAEDLAARVLTLPTYYGLPLEDVRVIAKNVKEMIVT